MPRFLIPVILVAAVSWVLWFYTLLRLPPEGVSPIILFFAIFLLALTFSLTATFFLVALKFADRLTDRRLLFRKWLRRAFFVSLAFTILGVLKTLSAFNYFNLILLISILAFTEIYLSKR